jgi:hypothetical protein
MGNLYYVTVKAVIAPSSPGEKFKLLGKARLDLDRY